MASPFSLFRKNQKVLMALLVGFSMIAFIVADSINATNFPIFLGAILGALGLWLLSGKGGTEGWLIAGVGAILGAVVGLYGPDLVGGNTAVLTAEGNLSHEDVNRLAREQDRANEFLMRASQVLREKLPEDQQASLQRPEPFGYVNVADSASQRENAVMTFLFGKEADKLGITLTDAAVQQFIVDLTQGKMTDADFRKIRTEMQIGTGELMDILRSQLRAREAFRLLVPRTGPTPQDLWADYQKLSVEAEATVAVIPADAFLSEIDDPSEDELTRFFEQYKAVPPGAEGSPGFLVPRQVQIASLEVAMADVKKTVTPPTDEEVRAYYEKNRAQFEFQPSGGTGITPSSTAGEAGDGSATPIEAPKPAAADAPAETPATETPATETPATETPATETPATEAPAGESSSTFDRVGLEFVAFQDEEAASSSSQAATDADTPAATASEKPAANPAAPPAPSANTAPLAEPSASVLAAIREDLINQRAREAADLKLEKALDDIHALVMEVEESVPLPENPQDPEQKAKYDEQRRAAVKDIVAGMKDYAAKHGLKYAATPFLSADELFESEKYPVGSAIGWEKNAPIFGRDTTPIVQTIFMSSPDQPLTPIPAQNLLNESRYVALKIADAAPRVPSLDEKPVRERVVTAWKLQQGRELAKARAEAIAKKAASDKSGLAEALKTETVTGGEGGQELTTRRVGPFTWLRRSTPPGQGFQLPDIVPNDLPQLPGAGEEFMQTVFETLDVGKTGVAASTDGSAYYVVQVEKRSSTEEIANMRDEFLKENPFFFLSPFRIRMSNEAFELRRKWFEDFRERHDVVFPADAETPATPA